MSAMHPVSQKQCKSKAQKMNHIDYMQNAERAALRSLCKRAQVGAVVVTKHGGKYGGHNHNRGYCCEGLDGRTLSTVVHAEAAAIKLGGIINNFLSGATLYVTRQPCLACAKLIVDSGIKQVYYRDQDDKSDGLVWLDDHGVSFDSRWKDGQIQDRYFADREGRG